MSDSETPPELAGKRAERLDQRFAQVKRWAEYVKSNPPEVWGEQLNTVVDAQLESARAAGESPERARRVDEQSEPR